MTAGDRFFEALADAVANRIVARLRLDGPDQSGEVPVRPRLLTVEQAAKYIGRSKEAVQHMTASRKLPVVRDGRRVFLDVKILDRWIEENTEPAEA